MPKKRGFMVIFDKERIILENILKCSFYVKNDEKLYHSEYKISKNEKGEKILEIIFSDLPKEKEEYQRIHQKTMTDYIHFMEKAT